jgi:hypothetical protein
VARHAEMPHLAFLVKFLEGLDQRFHFLVRIELVGAELAAHLGLRAPDIEIIGFQQSQARLNVKGLVLDVAAVGAAWAEVVNIGADVHLVPAALQGCAIAKALGGGGDVEVIYAGIDTGADHFRAVPGDVRGYFLVGEAVPVPPGVAVLPVPAKADLGQHQVRLAKPAVVHLFVIVQNLRCIDRFGGPRVSRQRPGDSPGGYYGRIPHEISSCKFIVLHWSSPSRLELLMAVIQ